MGADVLDVIARRYGTDKASTGHGFTVLYEQLIAPVRDRAFTLLEIGVETGASLRMWEEYLPRASIVGIDTRPDWIRHSFGERVSIAVGDQGDRGFLLSVAKEHGPFQIVIDDGGHNPREQVTSLLTLWPHLNPGGVYAVEDVHTSYLEHWRGGWRRQGTFVELVKEIVDDVNWRWHGQEAVLERLDSLLLRSEIAVFTKKLQPETTPIDHAELGALLDRVRRSGGRRPEQVRPSTSA